MSATSGATAAPSAGAAARARWARRGYIAFFALYLGGLLLWLLLGLLPPVVFAVPALTDELARVAVGHGPLAGFATTIELNRSMLSSGQAVAVEYLFSLLNLALGVLVTWRRPDGLEPRLLALAFIGTAATFNEPSHVVFHLLENAPLITAVHFTFHIVSGVAYLWAVLLFPDGRLPLVRAGQHRWVTRLAATASTGLIVWICYRSSFVAHPPFFVAFFGILVPVCGITSQTIRIRARDTSPVERQQSKLLRIALVPALLAAGVWLGAHAVELLGGSDSQGAADVADAVQAVFPAVFAVVPVMLFVAILRYRLWDIDLVVSRTLLWALLAGSVAVAYAAALGLTGWLFQDSVWSTLVALTVVALVAEPARQRSRKLANRIVFGTLLTPRESMQALADRLTASTATNELGELADLVVVGTRCTTAHVWLVTPSQLVLVASAPAAEPGERATLEVASATLADCVAALPGATCLPVTHEGQLLAVLAVTTPARVTIPSPELALIRDLAGHAGLLVANARLTTELAREVDRVTQQAAELLRSRQRVVAAQDAERERLERDIHDGAQQELVATLIQLRAEARTESGADPSGRLAGLREMVRTARVTIEELCRGGRPAVLADGGLPVALDAAAATARQGGLAVEVDCALGHRLPADAEAAIYFCCREALQNIVKHAHASRVTVQVQAAAGEAMLRVRDDGVGFDPAQSPHGSGMRNLRARIEAVGGTIVVESAPNSGTVTTCRMPLTTAAQLSELDV